MAGLAQAAGGPLPGWERIPPQQPLLFQPRPEDSVNPRAVLRLLAPNGLPSVRPHGGACHGIAGNHSEGPFSLNAPWKQQALKRNDQDTRPSTNCLLSFPNIKPCTPEEAAALIPSSQRIYVLPGVSSTKNSNENAESFGPKQTLSPNAVAEVFYPADASAGRGGHLFSRSPPNAQPQVQPEFVGHASSREKVLAANPQNPCLASAGPLCQDPSLSAHPPAFSNCETLPPRGAAGARDGASLGPSGFFGGRSEECKDEEDIGRKLLQQSEQAAECVSAVPHYGAGGWGPRVHEAKAADEFRERQAALVPQQSAREASDAAFFCPPPATQKTTLESLSLQEVVSRQQAEQSQLFESLRRQVLGGGNFLPGVVCSQEEEAELEAQDLEAQLQDVERQLQEKERQIRFIEQTVQQSRAQGESSALWEEGSGWRVASEAGPQTRSALRQGTQEETPQLGVQTSLQEEALQHRRLLEESLQREGRLLDKQRLLEEALESLRVQKEKHETELAAFQRDLALQHKELQEERERQRAEREQTVQELERHKEKALQRLNQERTRIQQLKQSVEEALSDQRLQLLHHHRELQLQLREQRQLQEEILEKQRQDLRRARKALENRELKELLLAFNAVQNEVRFQPPPAEQLLRAASLPLREASDPYLNGNECGGNCLVESCEEEDAVSAVLSTPRVQPTPPANSRSWRSPFSSSRDLTSAGLVRKAASSSCSDVSCSSGLAAAQPLLSRLPLSRLGSPDRQRAWERQLREQRGERKPERLERTASTGRLCGCEAYGLSHPQQQHRMCNGSAAKHRRHSRVRDEFCAGAAPTTTRFVSDKSLFSTEGPVATAAPYSSRNARQKDPFAAQSAAAAEHDAPQARPGKKGDVLAKKNRDFRDGAGHEASRQRRAKAGEAESLSVGLERLLRPTASQKQREKEQRHQRGFKTPSASRRSSGEEPPALSLDSQHNAGREARGPGSAEGKNPSLARTRQDGREGSESSRSLERLLEEASLGEEEALELQRSGEGPAASASRLLCKLADEQRRRIQLLMLEKAQLERATSLSPSSTPPLAQTESNSVLSEFQDAALESGTKALLPKEPYVPPEANCLVVSGKEVCESRRPL